MENYLSGYRNIVFSLNLNVEKFLLSLSGFISIFEKVGLHCRSQSESIRLLAYQAGG